MDVPSIVEGVSNTPRRVRHVPSTGPRGGGRLESAYINHLCNKSILSGMRLDLWQSPYGSEEVPHGEACKPEDCLRNFD